VTSTVQCSVEPAVVARAARLAAVQHLDSR